jgi:hypothetical protein
MKILFRDIIEDKETLYEDFVYRYEGKKYHKKNT